MSSDSTPTLLQQCLAEVLGMFLLVLFGCGSVGATGLTGAQMGVFQVAIVWGLGIAFAIQLTESCHIHSGGKPHPFPTSMTTGTTEPHPVSSARGERSQNI